MISANAAMPGSYDHLQVALSVLIAIAASYAALDLAGRVTAASGWSRSAWLTGGAAAMGIGIWSMHFTGMLAFSLPVPVGYQWPTVLLSLVAAILASAFALYVVSRQRLGMARALTGSLVMGGGIAAMHYTGMAAMRLAAVTRFAPLLVTLSVVLAIVFSFAALMLAFDLREETRGTPSRKIASASVMGTAVSAMHYTGMASANFMPSAVAPDLSHAVSISTLDTAGIGSVTLIVLGLAVLMCSVDRRLAAQASELERRVIERTSQLTATNDALTESEERFRKLVEALPDAILVVSEDRIVFVNPFGTKLLGAQQPEQLIGKDISEIIHPGSLASIRRRMQDCYQTGVASPPMEHVLISLDGSAVEIESAAIPITWKGSPAIEAIARDIRERKRAEQRLREYEKAVEGLEEMIVVVDREYRYVLANRAFLNYRGMEREELLGRLIQEVLNEGVFETVVKEKLDECFQGKAVTYEMKYRYPKLGERVLSLSYFPIEGPNGVDRAACILKDVTERKRAEEALRRLAAIVDSSDDAIISQDLNGVITSWNAAAQRIFGYTEAEALGQPITIIIPPELLNEETQTLRRMRAGEHIQHYETTRVTKQGMRVHVSLTVSPMKDSEGRVVGASKIAHDITESKRAEQALRESQAELARVIRIATMGELTASIAHEINQPLAAVVTNGNFCLRQLASGTPNLEELREAIAEIVNDGARASDVISRIRALLKKDASAKIELDINEVIQEAVVLVHGEVTRNQVSLRTDLAADLPRVFGDRVQLQQVLINLVLNGIDAMRTLTDRPRELLIKSAKHPDRVLVQVQDSGPGLDPQRADHIFEPFFTTKPRGIGMGLSISRSIVESHGGRLWAESGSKGALFQFTLPTSADGVS